MAALDFLYYYLTLWFSTSQTKNRIRTPEERTAYVLGIISMLWVMFICTAIEYFETKSFQKPFIPVFVYVLIGIGLTQLYQQIYIKKGRLNLIRNKDNPFSQYNLSNRKGVVISIVFCVASFLIPVILRVIIYKIAGV